ncbi:MULTISPECIES: hypothetical protein [Bradyrhizobium]|uniref:Uncharacterized protein n=2 Tax=Bradyrhizobium TaxID=374 RepID=A0ABY0QFE7_9BRAD|nr:MULTISPECIES: hypothetical protein [Bradyrhizobium]SDK14593.1 hypothetical protein SAMN05444163_7354 [Bradyrhizobium ottawaense]SEE50685.1 hypothetical protein SAMN05444171_7777 [Bradyrhizobium lablabi]
MPRLRSRYKKFRDGGVVRSDGSVAGTITPEPLEVQVDTALADIAADKATEHLLNAVESPQQHTTSIDVPTDEASSAFLKQIEDLRNAEQIQRQRQAAPAPTALPGTPEERLQLWRRQGVSEDDAEHLNELIEFPAITAEAVRDVERQGLNPNTREYHQAVRASFENHLLDRLHKPPERKAPKQVDRGGYVEPEQLGPAERNRSSLVSAPPSRDTFANGSYNSYGDRPGTVRLSKAQLEAAAFSGITPREYAEQLLRLREEKENGNYHGGQP